ncbi:MAG: PKD domain-containing protein [Candidatus Diapherotrites archaeon]|nr:PKD domain-containing protein [Candidatus Diapherotrites archaeon]
MCATCRVEGGFEGERPGLPRGGPGDSAPQRCKIKTRTNTVGVCQNAQCVTQSNTVRCEEFICPYGCAHSSILGEADCYPNAVIDSNIAPVGGQIEIVSDESIEFDCSNSDDPEGTALTCDWDFGDGNKASGAVVEHTYSCDIATCSYTVTLTVTDGAGLKDTETVIVNVLHVNSPPVADFTVNPVSGIVGITEFSFDASSSYDPDGFIVNYEWDFGDGEKIKGTDKVKVTHMYTKPMQGSNNISVTLTVEDDNGAKAQSTKTITVINNAPNAKFSAIPLRGINPLTVVFTAKATDPDGHKIVAYEWDFDNDGVIDSTDQDVIYKYEVPGTYKATLTVTDEYGARSVPFSIEIEVYELTGIKSLSASNVAVGEDTVIYVECAGTDKVDLTISSSDGSFSVTMNDVPCNGYTSHGPMEKAGVYTVTARVPGCNTLECTKSTTFNVFEEVAGEVETPEMHNLIVLLIAGIVIVMVRNKKGGF